MSVGRRNTPDALIRPDILAARIAYPSPMIGFTRLDTIENPWGLPIEAATKVEALCRITPLNRYPDPYARELKDVLRETFEIPPGAGIVLGNGCDEIIQNIVIALSRPGASCLTLTPTYSMYRQLSGLMGMKYVGVPLKEDFILDEAAFFAAMQAETPALIILGHPNNPTGNLLPREFILQVIERAPGLVVLDEACHFFAENSFLSEVARLPNLIVLRSLSRMGLAGLRLGFACGTEGWIESLEKLRLPYNIGIFTQQVAMMVMRDYAHLLEEQATLIAKQRQRLQKALAALPGMTVFPSEANFVLFRAEGAKSIFESLIEQKISIKYLHGMHPLLDDCLRVTVGSPTENIMFLSVLTKILEDRNATT